MTIRVRRICMTFFLIAYTLLFAEGFVRLLDPQAVMPRYITGTSWGIRGNIPNARYRHHTPEVDVEYRINDEGMRDDRHFPRDKPPGTCRIALFGDSFFVGYELELADTFGARLEADLRRDGYRVEVLNFAVSGFGTAEELRVYEAYARGFSPDLAVLEWHFTDLDDNVRADLFRLKDQQLVAGNSTYLPSVDTQDRLMRNWIYRFVSDHSELYGFVRERSAVLAKRAIQTLHGRKQQQLAEAVPERGDDDSPERAYRTALAAALLQQMRAELEADGRGLLVVDIPYPLSRTSFKSVWSRFSVAQARGIDVLSAAEVFRPLASPRTKLYYERGHGHLTPLAAAALASGAARRIEERNQLHGCR